MAERCWTTNNRQDCNRYVYVFIMVWIICPELSAIHIYLYTIYLNPKTFPLHSCNKVYVYIQYVPFFIDDWTTYQNTSWTHFFQLRIKITIKWYCCCCCYYAIGVVIVIIINVIEFALLWKYLFVNSYVIWSKREWTIPFEEGNRIER